MKQNLSVGVVCLTRNTFDFEAAAALYEGTKAELRALPGTDFHFVEAPIMSREEAEEAGRFLAARHCDGLIIISGTFHLGHLALTLDKWLHRPILLWGYDELPYNGGKIRLNSVCGVNLNASNLYKSGCDSYTCHIGAHMHLPWLQALRMTAALRHAHVGLAGYRADGFFNLDVEDTALFQKTGVLIDHYELSELMVPAESGGCTAGELSEIFDCSEVTAQQTEQVAALSGAMAQFMEKHQLDALALRCWPEFANTYGCAPCAAMSLLSAQGYTIGCEGDVEGTLSLLACNAVAEEPAFLADLSQVNFEEDYALMWHCGVAPYTLWDGRSQRSLDTYFAGGRGVTADFVMKSGPVTVMRIDSARGKTRVFLARGEAMPMEKELKGTYCKVRFTQSAAALLNTVTRAGVAHHVALVYGEYAAAFRAFAEMMHFEVIE